jgi:hypothetical protein
MTAKASMGIRDRFLNTTATIQDRRVKWGFKMALTRSVLSFRRLEYTARKHQRKWSPSWRRHGVADQKVA